MKIRIEIRGNYDEVGYYTVPKEHEDDIKEYIEEGDIDELKDAFERFDEIEINGWAVGPNELDEKWHRFARPDNVKFFVNDEELEFYNPESQAYDYAIGDCASSEVTFEEPEGMDEEEKKKYFYPIKEYVKLRQEEDPEALGCDIVEEIPVSILEYVYYDPCLPDLPLKNMVIGVYNEQDGTCGVEIEIDDDEEFNPADLYVLGVSSDIETTGLIDLLSDTDAFPITGIIYGNRYYPVEPLQANPVSSRFFIAETPYGEELYNDADCDEDDEDWDEDDD